MASSVIRFFKIILRSTLEDGNLKIPNNFTSKFGGSLPNPVFLRPPDGSEWKVYWTKQDGEILLQKGWKEFATYYSLDHGHLVVFEYEGNCSHFDVHIFGASALEIDYPITPDQIIDDDDDDSVEILNDLPLRQNKRLKGVKKSPNPQDMHQCVQTKGSHSEGTNFEMPIDAPVKQELDGGNASEITSLMISTCNAKTRALEEAKKFTTKNPFFMINIRQNYLLKSKPKLPINIIIKYFESKKVTNAMIKLGKKLWPVKLRYYDYPLGKLAQFSAGWALFAKESKLLVGDTCIFELVNRKDAVFKVHVFRGQRSEGVEKSPNPQDLHQCVQSKGENASEITSLLISTRNSTTRGLEEAKNFTTENPFVMINIRKIYQLKSTLTLSGSFIGNYFENKTEINAMMQLGKKMWPVKLLDYPLMKQGQFSAGWPRFAKESKLRVGDVCIFELINRKDAVFNVHVFRGQT